MPTADPPPLKVNRAPVLTLWAAMVAERLGHPPDAALTLGRAVAGASAQAKARRLGIADERNDDGGAPGERKTKARTVRLLGRDIAVDDEGTALDKGKPVSAAGVRTYLIRAFGDRLGEVRAAMDKLAASLPADELNRTGFRLYERFCPEVPEGVEGWGAKAVLDWASARCGPNDAIGLARDGRPRAPRRATRCRRSTPRACSRGPRYAERCRARRHPVRACVMSLPPFGAVLECRAATA
ncbi:MAG TPA: hypothetical protein VEX11_02085 [Acetobacteraceae bacterium]|nr:hypothetical protein [Acetobacteraceae bacterium]